MLHLNRKFTIEKIDSLEQLSSKIYLYPSNISTGYNLDNLFFLNDSLEQSTLVEWAVFIIEKNIWIQVDTLTSSLMSIEEITSTFRALLKGDFSFRIPITQKIHIDDYEALF